MARDSDRRGRAFLIGYFGISQLFDGDESEGITLEQGAGVPRDIERADLPDAVGGESPGDRGAATRPQRTVVAGLTISRG